MISILSINEMKEGDLITRVCCTNVYKGDSSFLGQKLKLIKLTNTDITIEILCKSGGGIYTVSRKEFEYGWTLYHLTGDEKNDTVLPYLDYKGQLRIQYIYLGFELDNARGSKTLKGQNKFGDYLQICRYIESLISQTHNS